LRERVTQLNEEIAASASEKAKDKEIALVEGTGRRSPTVRSASGAA
jgi:hypothetical protein